MYTLNNILNLYLPPTVYKKTPINVFFCDA